MRRQVEIAYGKINRLEDTGYDINEIFDSLDEYLTSKNLAELYDKFLEVEELSKAEYVLLRDAFEVFAAEF